jgi:peptidyl-tRNA hydrolase, PTH2 family
VSQEISVQDQTYKQVIVMRHDLMMRRGKQIAQGAHASMAFLTSRLKVSGVVSMGDFNEAAKAWLSGRFAKICCRVESEDELLAIRDQASQQGLEVHLITDSGKTEFHGVPTNTCLAIGPDEAAKIDAITGALKLL